LWTVTDTSSPTDTSAVKLITPTHDSSYDKTELMQYLVMVVTLKMFTHDK